MELPGTNIKLSETKIGDKFFIENRMYLRIDLEPSKMSLTTKFPDLICVLDLCTYKIMCFMKDVQVILEGDNVSI